MKNIVVAGGGPIGLYIAIRLTQIINKLGLNTTVTSVDLRVGEYDRPGVVANKALELISEGLKTYIPVKQHGDDTGTSMFIKDMEKSLYDIALERGVRFVKGKVEACDARKVFISRPGKSELLAIPCDLALDCTGPRRTLVNINNKNHGSKKPFTVERVGNNPIINHFIAYVVMDERNASLVSEKKEHDPLKYALAMERLRNEFGWEHFVEPEFSLRRYTIKGVSGAPDAYRYYFYFEIPPHIAESDRSMQIKWLQALIQLKSENADVEFTVEEGKMKFIPFDVDPHHVKEAYAAGDEFMMDTVPMGDAQIEPDYRLGVGIWSGVSRANALINSISISSDGELVINLKQYEHLVDFPKSVHHGQLESDYRLRQSALFDVLEKQKKWYLAAMRMTTDTSEQAIIQRGLDEINRRLAVHFLNEARAAYAIAVDTANENRIRLNKSKDIISKNELIQCRKNLTLALSLVPQSCQTERALIQSALFKLAMSYKSLGADYFNGRHLEKALSSYQISLDILASQLNGLGLDEQVRIYSNLALIAIKKNDFNTAIAYARQALEIMPSVEMDGKDDFVVKVKYRYCLAKINQLNVETSKQGYDSEGSKREFESVRVTYDGIKSGLGATEIQMIDGLLEQVRARLTPPTPVQSSQVKPENSGY